jgi:hypothetical protein
LKIDPVTDRLVWKADLQNGRVVKGGIEFSSTSLTSFRILSFIYRGCRFSLLFAKTFAKVSRST